MQRVVEEAEYVLANLRRALKELTANPELFTPDAQEKIEKAIVYFEWVRQKAKATKAAEVGKAA